MMKKNKDALSSLIDALKVLPNVGPKSAQRMAYQLLQHHREGAQHLVEALQNALLLVKHCRLCHTFCEDDLCPICADETRNPKSMMLVHMPIDVASMEASNCHDGVYFVLMGQVNPAQGMNLEHIAINELVARLKNSEVEEIIIATNFTAEGDATAYVLAELLKNLPYKLSRLARGMPLGGELEFVDAGTLAQAVYERKVLSQKTD